MRGHEQLIAMRMRGRRPPFVRFETDPMPWKDWADWPEWASAAMVEVQPSDVIRRLDLRCVVGIPAVVMGSDDARVAEMFGALVAAGASRVLAFSDRSTIDSLEAKTWPE